MINVNLLKTGLSGLIGWHQNEDPNGEQLTELTESSSGLYFNDVHPLLSFDALRSIYEDKGIEYNVHSVGTNYVAGDKVKQGVKNYYALVDTTGTDPSTEPLVWKEFNSFSLWLKKKTEAFMMMAVNDWYNKKSKLGSANNLLETDQVFRSGGKGVTNHSTIEGRDVGFEIVPGRSNGVKVRIREIGLHTSGEESGLNVRLFKGSEDISIQTESFVIVGSSAGKVLWKTVNWDLDPSGSYYILIDSQTVESELVNDTQDFNRDESGSTDFPFSKFFRISACYTPTDPFNPSDVEDIVYTIDDNYGLNFRFDVYCDYTEFVINQKDIFKFAIYRRVGLEFLKLFAYNPDAQSNRYTSRYGLNDLLFEIYGDTQSTSKRTGLLVEYMDDLSAITFDKKALSKDCLPCRKALVNYTSVY